MHSITKSYSGDLELTELLIKRSEGSVNQSVVFMHGTKDGLYVGVEGLVKEILHEDHPCAHEILRFRGGDQKGRPIRFVHAFFAKRGASVPALSELLETQALNLDHLLRKAQADGATYGNPVSVPEITFGSSRASMSEFDLIAKEFQAGKHVGKTATFTRDGMLFEWLKSVAVQEEHSATQVLGLSKKNLTPKLPTRIAFLPFALITIGALSAGWLIWEIARRVQKQNNENERSK